MRNGYSPQDLANTNEVFWHVEILFSKINCSGIWDHKDNHLEGWAIRGLDVESPKWLKTQGEGRSSKFRYLENHQQFRELFHM